MQITATKFALHKTPHIATALHTAHVPSLSIGNGHLQKVA